MYLAVSNSETSWPCKEWRKIGDVLPCGAGETVQSDKGEGRSLKQILECYISPPSHYNILSYDLFTWVKGISKLWPRHQNNSVSWHGGFRNTLRTGLQIYCYLRINLYRKVLKESEDWRVWWCYWWDNFDKRSWGHVTWCQDVVYIKTFNSRLVIIHIDRRLYKEIPSVFSPEIIASVFWVIEKLETADIPTFKSHFTITLS